METIVKYTIDDMLAWLKKMEADVSIPTLEPSMSLSRILKDGTVYVVTDDDNDIGICSDDVHLLIQEGMVIADCVLIDEQGQMDHRNRKRLTDAGYRITVFEQDSFGPLAAGVITPKGILCFG